MRDNTAVTPVITAVSGGLAFVCVLLRIVDRFPQWSQLQWADLCVVLALVCDAVYTISVEGKVLIAVQVFAIPMAVLEFIMSKDGFGKDIWTIPFDQITRIVKVRIAYV